MTMECTFWAVGQGLFSSGKIYDENSNAKPFTWVYDCGSVKKSRSNLLSSIQQMRLENQGDIDLLMISHFDEDHISGLEELLKGKKVKRLILPYYSLYERLILAIENKIAISSALFSFYLNPVEYLLNTLDTALGKEGKILLLPVTENVVFPLEPINDENEKWDYPSDDNFLFSDQRVCLLPKGWSVFFPTYDGKVEFVPYNAPLSMLKKYPNNDQEWQQFYNAVNQFEKSGKYTQKDIKQLKDIYDHAFVRTYKSKGNEKKNSKDRNIISAFLYVGFIDKKESVKTVNYYRQLSLYEQAERDYITPDSCELIFGGDKFFITNKRNAILYSGDGSLSNKEQFDHLQIALGDQRIRNIACFQVLHHGSRHNWHKGLADKIQPCISVFSADPNYANYKHPHAEVVKDFLPYSPILVDQYSYLKFSIK